MKNIQIDSSLINSDEFKYVKQSLVAVSSKDGKADYRVKTLEYINDSCENNDDMFFYDMLEFVRFLDPTDPESQGHVAYTTPERLIYFNMPCDLIKNARQWDFTHGHECLHQLWDTFGVADEIKSKGLEYNHQLLNIASDCVINQYLRDLRHKECPNGLITPESLKENFDVDYDFRNDTQFSLYVKLLKKYQEFEEEFKKFLQDHPELQDDDPGDQDDSEDSDDTTDGPPPGGFPPKGPPPGGPRKKGKGNSPSNSNNRGGKGKGDDSGGDDGDDGNKGDNDGDGKDGKGKGSDGKDGKGKGSDSGDNNEKPSHTPETASEAADRAQKAADEAKKEAAASGNAKDKANARKAQAAADKAKAAADKAKNASSEKEKAAATKEAVKAADEAEDAECAVGSNSGSGNAGERLDDIKKRAEGIIEKYRNKIAGDFGKFISKCKSSITLNPSGLKIDTGGRGVSGWASKMNTYINGFVKKKVFSKKREIEKTYKRMNRRQGVVRAGDPIQKGKRVKKSSLTINAAFYIDRSGSMASCIQSVYKAAYNICESLKKHFKSEKVVEEITFRMHAFDDEMKRLKYGDTTGPGGGTMSFHTILSYITQHTSDFMINVIITDAEFDIDEVEVKKLIKNIDGMILFVTNTENLTMKKLSNQYSTQLFYILADRDFKI